MTDQEISYIEEQILNKRVKFVKVEDCRFNGSHPNRVNNGHTEVGVCRQVFPYVYIDGGNMWFHSSAVFGVSQVSDSRFEVRTRNSVYQLDLL